MIDTNKYQIKLAEEKTRVEIALNEIGQRDPRNAENWNVNPVDTNDIAFHDEVADRFEEMDNRKATEFSLESELASINDALKAIEAGTYGHCKVCDKEIETDRLDASPTATTCIEHLEA